MAGRGPGTWLEEAWEHGCKRPGNMARRGLGTWPGNIAGRGLGTWPGNMAWEHG